MAAHHERTDDMTCHLPRMCPKALRHSGGGIGELTHGCGWGACFLDVLG